MILRAQRFLSMFLGVSLLFGAVAWAPVAPTAFAQTTSARNWHVVAGSSGANNKIAGMRYYPQTMTIDVGDSITWTVSGGAHTVTFLSGATAPSPEDPSVESPQGGTTYDGKGIVSSGILQPGTSTDTAPHTYTLTFTTAGTFTYNCLFHPGMTGTVVVNPVGTAYPTSQRQYDRQSWLTSTEDLFAGLSLIATHPTPRSTQNSDGTRTYQVQAGLGNGTVSVMRFLPTVRFVHVNDSITWTNNDPMEPHTVTFPAGATSLPEPPDPAAFAPIGGSTFDGTAPVSSGLLLPQGAGGTNSYTLKFTQAGRFNYICLLHDDMGMVGTVIVLP